MHKKKDKKGLIHILKNNFYMLRYVFKYIPVYAVLHIIMQILFGLFDVMWSILIMKIVGDAVFETKSFMTVLYSAGGMFIYGAVIQITAAYMYEIYAPIQTEKLNRAINRDLHKKAVSIDYSCYSNPGFYNDFVWAASQANGKAIEVLELVAGFFKNMTTISGIIAVMLTLDLISFIIVLISTAATFVMQLIINKIRIKKAEEDKPFERKRDYVNRVFYLIDYAKEMRLSKLRYNLENDYKSANGDLKDNTEKYGNKFIGMQMISNVAFEFIIINTFLFLLLGFRAAVLKTLSAGSFMALIDGSWSLKWSLNNLSSTITGLHDKSLYIEKFRTFINYDNKIKDTKDSADIPDRIGALSLKNVSFTYEGSEIPTLKNINLDIEPKEKIAIVGYNGAGKSTLIKLITRLYDVSEGEILYSGRNIKDYKVKQYYNNFGTVFQDHELFAGTLRENVLMDTDDENDREKTVTDALEKSGFTDKLNALENGTQSNMTKEFYDDGLVLSGGEKQKVAIARAFANAKSNVLILDEPSSALDPLSEYNLNKSMLEAAKEKTVIFISHRLSTTKIADRIYMMENGQIIETGSHEQLMKNNGKYAEMFKLQTSSYAKFEHV